MRDVSPNCSVCGSPNHLGGFHQMNGLYDHLGNDQGMGVLDTVLEDFLAKYKQEAISVGIQALLMQAAVFSVIVLAIVKTNRSRV